MSTAVSARHRTRLRRAPDFDHVKFVRRVKGAKWQVRWWLSEHGSVNCGLYDRELALVVKRELVFETQHHADTPLDLWAALCVVLDRLRALGTAVPAFVAPMYVFRLKDGTGYGARAWFGKGPGRRRVELAGPFDTPEAAHRAFVELLARGTRAVT